MSSKSTEIIEKLILDITQKCTTLHVLYISHYMQKTESITPALKSRRNSSSKRKGVKIYCRVGRICFYYYINTVVCLNYTVITSLINFKVCNTNTINGGTAFLTIFSTDVHAIMWLSFSVVAPVEWSRRGCCDLFRGRWNSSYPSCSHQVSYIHWSWSILFLNGETDFVLHRQTMRQN